MRPRLVLQVALVAAKCCAVLAGGLWLLGLMPLALLSLGLLARTLDERNAWAQGQRR